MKALCQSITAQELLGTCLELRALLKKFPERLKTLSQKGSGVGGYVIVEDGLGKFCSLPTPRPKGHLEIQWPKQK